jgi:hypothetical protein
MNCDDALRALSLYEYGELDATTEDNLESHLHTCSSCGQEWKQQRAISQALSQREIEAPPALLEQCRQELTRSLYRESAQPAASRHNAGWPFRDLAAMLFGPGVRLRQALGAVALVALGYFSAHLTFFSGAGVVSLAGLIPDGMVSRVRSVQPDSSGRVQISVDETRQRVVSGRSDEPAIQQLLLAAAREEDNPGLRVESVSVLKDHCASAEIRGALLEAVEHDPNPGVRLKALEGLKTLTLTPDAKKSLAQVLLKDDNAGVRIQVIDLLMTQRDGSMVGVLQTLVDREENSYVRMRCRKALQEMNASVGTF